MQKMIRMTLAVLVVGRLSPGLRGRCGAPADLGRFFRAGG